MKGKAGKLCFESNWGRGASPASISLRSRPRVAIQSLFFFFSFLFFLFSHSPCPTVPSFLAQNRTPARLCGFSFLPHASTSLPLPSSSCCSTTTPLLFHLPALARPCHPSPLTTPKAPAHRPAHRPVPLARQKPAKSAQCHAAFPLSLGSSFRSFSPPSTLGRRLGTRFSHSRISPLLFVLAQAIHRFSSRSSGARETRPASPSGQTACCRLFLSRRHPRPVRESCGEAHSSRLGDRRT